MTKPFLIDFQLHGNDTGVLCVYETGKSVPFQISRVFTVSAKKDEVRGNHAHKQCSQLLVCVSGEIEVTCDNGTDESIYQLNNMGQGLLIPPGIWAVEKYIREDSVLIVLCDRGYEEEDYIRDYDEFKNHIMK